MRLIDLIKTTVFCGGTAWLAVNFPAFSQVIIVAALSILWLTYLHSAVRHWRQH